MNRDKAYEIYINEILKWNKVHKLISKADESKIFERHIKDAEEIFYKLKDFDIKEIADVGAGAGFLGVVFSTRYFIILCFTPKSTNTKCFELL